MIPMHIAINGWFWNQPDTGSGQYVRELLRALRQIDKANDYTLVIPGHKNTPDNVPDGVNIITTGSSPDSKPGKV
ncbi:MAG: hypothetical protein AAFR22_10135, partial [Chloroflexota bacterium]